MTQVTNIKKDTTQPTTDKETQERTFKLLKQQVEKHIDVFKRLKDK